MDWYVDLMGLCGVYGHLRCGLNVTPIYISLVL